MFCTFWALDIAPTLDVLVLFIFVGSASKEKFTKDSRSSFRFSDIVRLSSFRLYPNSPQGGAFASHKSLAFWNELAVALCSNGPPISENLRYIQNFNLLYELH